MTGACRVGNVVYWMEDNGCWWYQVLAAGRNRGDHRDVCIGGKVWPEADRGTFFTKSEQYMGPQYKTRADLWAELKKYREVTKLDLWDRMKAAERFTRGVSA